MKLGARQNSMVLRKPHADLHPLQICSSYLRPQTFLTRYIKLLPRIFDMNHECLLSISNVHTCPTQIHRCHQHKSSWLGFCALGYNLSRCGVTVHLAHGISCCTNPPHYAPADQGAGGLSSADLPSLPKSSQKSHTQQTQPGSHKLVQPLPQVTKPRNHAG